MVRCCLEHPEAASDAVRAPQGRMEANQPTPAEGAPGSPAKQKKQIGFGDNFPASLLEEIRVELRYKEKARKVGLIVSQSLIVIGMYSSAFSGKVFNGDWVTKVNDRAMTKKSMVYDELENALHSHKEFVMVVKRPRWLIPTSTVPKGYDVAPGYEYFSGLMVLYPNATVGLNVKAFNNRIYIVRVETDSMASHSCLAGDCIVDVDGVPVTTITDSTDRIVRGLKDKKYVNMTIERAATEMTIRAVRCALFAEKTTPIDPRLAADTQRMGEEEATRIRASKVPDAPKSILKTGGTGVTGVSFYGTEKAHIEVLEASQEFTIGCEPTNPLFFHKVKQRPTTDGLPGSGSASGSQTSSGESFKKVAVSNTGGGTAQSRDSLDGSSKTNKSRLVLKSCYENVGASGSPHEKSMMGKAAEAFGHAKPEDIDGSRKAPNRQVQSAKTFKKTAKKK